MKRTRERTIDGGRVQASCQSRFSEVPRLGRGRLPIVIAPIKILNRCVGEFVEIHVIEAAELDRVEVPANGIDVPVCEWSHPAMLAKRMVDAIGGKLIIS